MTHILHPGEYIVANKANNFHIGPGNEEDFLLPKPIVTLPGGVRAPIWKVVPLSNGCYKLAVLKPPGPEWYYVADINDKVYALDPEDQVKPTEWIIKPIEGYGPNVYIIEVPSRKVWTIPNEKPYTQIILEPRIPHSPTQHFIFYPVLGDSDKDRDD